MADHDWCDSIVTVEENNYGFLSQFKCREPAGHLGRHQTRMEAWKFGEVSGIRVFIEWDDIPK